MKFWFLKKKTVLVQYKKNIRPKLEKRGVAWNPQKACEGKFIHSLHFDFPLNCPEIETLQFQFCHVLSLQISGFQYVFFLEMTWIPDFKNGNNGTLQRNKAFWKFGMSRKKADFKQKMNRYRNFSNFGAFQGKLKMPFQGTSHIWQKWKMPNIGPTVVSR